MRRALPRSANRTAPHIATVAPIAALEPERKGGAKSDGVTSSAASSHKTNLARGACFVPSSVEFPRLALPSAKNPPRPPPDPSADPSSPPSHSQTTTHSRRILETSETATTPTLNLFDPNAKNNLQPRSQARVTISTTIATSITSSAVFCDEKKGQVGREGSQGLKVRGGRGKGGGGLKRVTDNATEYVCVCVCVFVCVCEDDRETR